MNSRTFGSCLKRICPRPAASMSKPHFIIMGERRSGSTTLYHMLSQHPEVSMLQPVDFDYFIEPELIDSISFDNSPVKETPKFCSLQTLTKLVKIAISKSLFVFTILFMAIRNFCLFCSYLPSGHNWSFFDFPRCLGYHCSYSCHKRNLHHEPGKQLDYPVMA